MLAFTSSVPIVRRPALSSPLPSPILSSHHHSTPCATLSLSRRALLALPLALSLTVLPTPASARRKPKLPLITSLVPVVRLSASLADLSDDINAGNSNRDLSRTIRTLLKGNPLAPSLRDAGLWISPAKAEIAESAGREAVEYLDQTLAYFDPVAMSEKPQSEYLSFAVRAVDAAKQRLDVCLGCFEDEEVENAKRQLTVQMYSGE